MNKKYYRSDNRRAFYESRIKSQAGKCAICGRKERLVIDHDHLSGLMRGLLCYKHNTALGLFNDNPELLNSAANYLKTHQPELLNEVKKLTEGYQNYNLAKKLIPSLLSDNRYPSDRARARVLAQKTGCPVSTAQTRIVRARKKMLDI